MLTFSGKKKWNAHLLKSTIFDLGILNFPKNKKFYRKILQKYNFVLNELNYYMMRIIFNDWTILNQITLLFLLRFKLLQLFQWKSTNARFFSVQVLTKGIKNKEGSIQFFNETLKDDGTNHIKQLAIIANIDPFYGSQANIHTHTHTHPLTGTQTRKTSTKFWAIN